jgi:hypothetical protein
MREIEQPVLRQAAERATAPTGPAPVKEPAQ